jgi:signal transduction histidine kinase
MAIAKGTVEAHGGQLAVGNALVGGSAQGAEIIITLPRTNP